MKNNDTLKAEIKALRERLARLSEASLRISDSLDLNTVLKEVVAGTCALTGAGIGGITTRDESGRMLDFITQGLSPDERRQLLDLPEGAELWAYLKEVAEPLRLKDLSAHLASLGLPTHGLMERSFLGMPVRHQDLPIGFLYILDKADAREFTDEDEEIMALFASQAGAAIGNASMYHDEQKARGDLEALTETTPVGVVVIDYQERRVELKGEPLRLTATEFDLLRILSTHAGRVVTYDQMLSNVWQMRNSGDAHVVRVFVKKLRRKLGDDARNRRTSSPSPGWDTGWPG